MCTKPRRSWLESRNPIPRPIPVSNDEADRDRLNVAMHWYGFHTFTIRSTCSFGVETCSTSRCSAQRSRTRPSAASTSLAPPVAFDHREDGPSCQSRRSRRVELRIRRVLRVAEEEDDLAGLARRQLELPRGASRSVPSRARSNRRDVPRSTASGRSQPRYGPRKLLALGVEAGELLEQAKYAKWFRRSRYSVVW